MTPEQFVVWLRGEIDWYRTPGEPEGVLEYHLQGSPFTARLLEQLATVVLKTQPPQPGVPGVLGQGLMKLEKADPSAVPVFNGGGCQ